MRSIKFEKLKLSHGQGYWFSAEYFIDGILRRGKGCHYSNKEQVKLIMNEYIRLVNNE